METVPPAGTGGRVGVGFAVVFATGGGASELDEAGSPVGDAHAVAPAHSSRRIATQARFMID
jgi:hypothetical protein